MKKIPIRRKGCRNATKTFIESGHYIDCDENCDTKHGNWVIVPLHEGKPMTWISKKINVSGERLEMKNVYFDVKSGELKRI